MPEPLLCPTCGGSLIAGRCLACDARRWSRFVHREIVLLSLLAGVAVVAFLVTRAIAADDERLRHQQAAAWFEVAQQRLRTGRIDDALVGLRRAVVKDRENRPYRLALTRALVASGRDEEARRMLLDLRDAQPEDPDTNLQLARLEARRDDGDAARRYYEYALAALWRPDQAARRRLLRLELIDLLLQRDERARALAELLVLAANLPEDAAAYVPVGRRFLDAGDPRRALDHFVLALRAEPGNRDALAGAGDSAFALGDYLRALRYLGALPATDERMADLREVARLVLAGDPLAPRLRAAERRRRLIAAFQQATSRLEMCLAMATAGAAPRLESLRDESRVLATALNRRGTPRDVIDDGVDLVYRIERAAEQGCAVPAEPLDRALLVIGRRYGFGDA
jgi:tetratricopeptide (TPR) repeat protein